MSLFRSNNVHTLNFGCMAIIKRFKSWHGYSLGQVVGGSHAAQLGKPMFYHAMNCEAFT